MSENIHDVNKIYTEHFEEKQNRRFFPALQRLVEEHPPLIEQMEKLSAKADDVLSSNEENWEAGLRELVDMLRSFKVELTEHSEREESGLFPMMDRYIGGGEGSPLAIMELEHNQAKDLLDEFEDRYEAFFGTGASKGVQFNADRVGRLTIVLKQAIDVLMQHFFKEENAIFPMAEQMLTDEEKEELLKMWD